MYIHKFVFLMISSLALTACVNDDPAYKAEQAQQRAVVAKNAMNVSEQEFKPLVAVCMDALETGAPVSATKMASLGFSKAAVGYKKSRAESTIDRLNGQNTTFVSRTDSCSMGLGNFSGVQQAGAVVRSSLEARGYTFVSRSKQGFVFEKSGRSVVMNGFFYSSFTNVSIKRIS